MVDFFTSKFLHYWESSHVCSDNILWVLNLFLDMRVLPMTLFMHNQDFIPDTHLNCPIQAIWDLFRSSGHFQQKLKSIITLLQSLLSQYSCLFHVSKMSQLYHRSLKRVSNLYCNYALNFQSLKLQVLKKYLCYHIVTLYKHISWFAQRFPIFYLPNVNNKISMILIPIQFFSTLFYNILIISSFLHINHQSK